MKKRIGKLKLNRETIRSLVNGEIRGVAGASANTSCECIIATGCDCASQGGTDCYEPTMCLWGCSASAQTCRC